MYHLLHQATAKAIEALQNALMDIENMGMSAEEELLPGYFNGANGVTYMEKKSNAKALGADASAP